MYIETQLHLTHLGNMSSDSLFAPILVVSMLATSSAIKYFEENNSSSEVATATISTGMAFAELWVSNLVSHWK